MRRAQTSCLLKKTRRKMGDLRRVHWSELEILSMARPQPAMGPDIEKRTVSSAKVPNLNGERLAVRELVPLLARRSGLVRSAST